jgi:hypothetical protein
MEKESKYTESFDRCFKSALVEWKDHPEQQVPRAFLNETFALADRYKVGVDIKIFAKYFENGQRSILQTDLKKWFRREGEFFVAEFRPKKGKVANAKVRAVEDADGQGVLIILNNEFGEYSRQATIFPHEIASFEVK